jgi:hypothetical protein
MQAWSSRGARRIGSQIWFAFVAATMSCSNEYLVATGAFGQTVRDTSATMPSDMGIGTVVCRRRAQLDFLQRRVEHDRKPAFDWGTGSAFVEWFAVQGADAQHTWAQHCEHFADADLLFEKALDILGQYGDALKNLAQRGSYDGKEVQAAAGSAGQLAAAVGQDAVGKDIGGVGVPLAKVAQLLAQHYASREGRELVVESQPSVHLVLASLEGYCDAIVLEIADEKSRVQQLLDTVETEVAREAGASGGARNPGVLSTLAYGQIADDLTSHARRAADATRRMRTVLVDLTSALDKLAQTPAADLKGFRASIDAVEKDLSAVHRSEWQ